MSRTTPYADLGKVPADLIKKGFPAEGFQVVSEAKIPLGCALKTTLSKGPKGVKLAVENTDYTWTALGHTWNWKGKWQSDNLIEKSVAVSDLVTPGTEIKPFYKQEMVPVFDVNGTETSKTLERSVGVSAGFVNEFVNISFKPETDPTLSARKLEASLVFQAPKNLFWGFKAKYDPVAPSAEAEKPQDPKSNWDLDFRLHYALPDSSFTLAYEPDPIDKKNTQKAGSNLLGFKIFRHP